MTSTTGVCATATRAAIIWSRYRVSLGMRRRRFVREPCQVVLPQRLLVRLPRVRHVCSGQVRTCSDALIPPS